jgi:hypothetical protein
MTLGRTLVGRSGRKDVLKVEDWAEIRRLYLAEGLGKQTIAKRLGVARNTVKAALASQDPPSYRRQRRPSAVEPYEDEIRRLLKGLQHDAGDGDRRAHRVGARHDDPQGNASGSCARSFWNPIPSSGPPIVPGSSPNGTCGSPRPTSRSATGTARVCR